MSSNFPEQWKQTRILSKLLHFRKYSIFVDDISMLKRNFCRKNLYTTTLWTEILGEYVMQSYLIHMVSNVFTPTRDVWSECEKQNPKKIIIIFHLPDWSDRGWLKDGELPLRRPFLNYRMHVNRWMNKFSFNFDLDENIETTLRLQSFRLTFIALQWFYHTFTVKIIGNTCLCKCMLVCGPQCKLVPTAT